MIIETNVQQFRNAFDQFLTVYKDEIRVLGERYDSPSYDNIIRKIEAEIEQTRRLADAFVGIGQRWRVHAVALHQLHTNTSQGLAVLKHNTAVLQHSVREASFHKEPFDHQAAYRDGRQAFITCEANVHQLHQRLQTVFADYGEFADAAGALNSVQARAWARIIDLSKILPELSEILGTAYRPQNPLDIDDLFAMPEHELARCLRMGRTWIKAFQNECIQAWNQTWSAKHQYHEMALIEVVRHGNYLHGLRWPADDRTHGFTFGLTDAGDDML